MTRIARTTAAFLTALLLFGFAFALNNADLNVVPDFHYPVASSSASTSSMVMVADINSSDSYVAARAYAESFGLAVD